MSPDEPELTRDQKRSRRKRGVRSKTINISRYPKAAIELGRKLHPPVDIERPRTRKECVGGIRPCPFVSCRQHLYLDVSPKTGNIKINFPDLEVWELKHSCALDVPDSTEGRGLKVEDLGSRLNVTREQARKIVRLSLARASKVLDGVEEPSDLDDDEE